MLQFHENRSLDYYASESWFSIEISSNNCKIMIYKTFWSQKKGVQIFGSIEQFSWNCNRTVKKGVPDGLTMVGGLKATF